MNSNVTDKISQATLNRLPIYLNFLKTLPPAENANISAPKIAKALRLGYIQVRKDLAFVTSSGKPKIGYVTRELISDLESFLGYNSVDEAILVGAGKLGRAILEYGGFGDYGISISAAFDVGESCGKTASGKYVYDISELPAYCKSRGIRIGIICVPHDSAQSICNMMVAGGITAIMNFAPTHLNVPKSVIVQNENIAASIALLNANSKGKNSKK